MTLCAIGKLSRLGRRKFRHRLRLWHQDQHLLQRRHRLQHPLTRRSIFISRTREVVGSVGIS
uniref:Uncharacterized protein n=1 Tax=uncultured marine virus TaxID=186617 RepID=A0A0F7L3P5_9VIRU|nr:hypothetical protein [uncultured marine virus]